MDKGKQQVVAGFFGGLAAWVGFTCPNCKKPTHIALIGRSGKSRGKNPRIGIYHDHNGSSYCNKKEE